jgi:hypothetical protein
VLEFGDVVRVSNVVEKFFEVKIVGTNRGAVVYKRLEVGINKSAISIYFLGIKKGSFGSELRAGGVCP